MIAATLLRESMRVNICFSPQTFHRHPWEDCIKTSVICVGRGLIVPGNGYRSEAKNIGSEAEIVDRAGNAILGLVSRAADVAAADLKEAREVAEKLADQLRAANEQLQVAHDQLRAAHDQINDLKADVRHYQDRNNRAEKWAPANLIGDRTKVFRRG
jgi:hypothetical protein